MGLGEGLLGADWTDPSGYGGNECSSGREGIWEEMSLLERAGMLEKLRLEMRWRVGAPAWGSHPCPVKEGRSEARAVTAAKGCGRSGLPRRAMMPPESTEPLVACTPLPPQGSVLTAPPQLGDSSR